MGYWGWRPLVFGLFISTWVVGCNIVTDNTAASAAPSPYPSVTLTVGRLAAPRAPDALTRAAPSRFPTPSPQPSATLAPYIVQPADTLSTIASKFDVSVAALQQANKGAAALAAGQTLLIPAPTPLPLSVDPPTCYETRPHNLLCLGRVVNPLQFPAEGVTVEVHLLLPDGTLFLSERAALEQISIPPGSFAPYQATFEADSDDFASADASLIDATRGSEDHFVMLTIQGLKGVLINDQMTISATIYNPGTQPAELLRVFVTLLDPSGQVIGYRVVTFDTGIVLTVGAHLPLNIDLTPQVLDPTPEVNIYVEAQAVES